MNCHVCGFICHHYHYNQDCNCTCICDTGGEVLSLIQTETITADQYKDYLFDTLTVNDPCPPENLKDDIDVLWVLYCNSSACISGEATYLTVRLEVLKMMMLCSVWSVDTRTSISESNSKTQSKTKADSWTQAQSTSYSNTYSDSIFESTYNDFADSILRADSERNALAESHDESRTRTDDIGQGASESTTIGERNSESESKTSDSSQSQANSSGSGSRCGFDWSFSHSRTESNTPFLVIGGGSRIGTKTANSRQMRSDSYNSTESDRKGYSMKSLRSQSQSDSDSLRQSSSFFNAIMDSNTNSASGAAAHDHSRSGSDQTSVSEGLGQSASESEGRSSQSSQRTSQSHSLSESETDGHGHSYSISEFYANSDRFRHLKVLYENTEMILNEFYRLRRAAYGFGWAKLITSTCDGYIPIGTIEQKLCLPGGVNGIYCCSTGKEVSNVYQ